LLPQQGGLVDGSVLDNITMFEPALQDRALEVAATLGLDRVVASLRQGYDTPVGNRAMPAGIVQRIAIARVLVRNPAVLLLEEANIALDAGGDEALRTVLEALKGQRTLVLVTHRPSRLGLADRVVTLKDGRLLDGEDGEAAPVDAAPLPPAPERPAGDERLSVAVIGHFPRTSDLALCLTALLKASDWRGGVGPLVEALPHGDDSLDLDGLRRVMGNLGFTGDRRATTLKAVDPSQLPALFLPRDGAALVLVRAEAGKGLFVFDGGQGRTAWLAADAAAGELYVFRRSEPSAAPRDGARWLRSPMRAGRPALALAAALSVALNLLALAAPLLAVGIYDHWIPDGDLARLPLLAVGLLLALALEGVLRFVRARLLAALGGRWAVMVGGAVFRRIVALPAWVAEQTALDRRMRWLRDVETLRHGGLALLAFEGGASLVFVAALGAIEPWLTVVAVVALAAFVLLGLLAQPRGAALAAAAARAGAARQEFLADALTKMRAIRQSGAESRWLGRFRTLSAEAADTDRRWREHEARVAVAGYALGQGTVLAAAVVGALGVIEGAASGLVVAAMLVTARLVAPLQSGFASVAPLTRAAAALRRIDRLMREGSEGEAAAARQTPRSFAGEIQFSRASFRYAREAEPAVLGASLLVEPGRMVAITGPNGAGKSTLLKLATGLYPPQAGSVRIDGIDLRERSAADLRALVSYAPQRAEVFSGTIADNLRLAHPGASEDELRWAAVLAGLNDDVLVLPAGFETMLGDAAGESLPNGFRQRLSLARTYLKPAKVLLFDEPGNGLDAAGDRLFQAAIAALRRHATIVIVSHRPSHLRLADAVVTMEGGCIRTAGGVAQKETVVMGTLR
ncbi:MAG: ATP-binding cassette domain-containing protein, partial [Magnetospirillum sp.]|nr:ATP-binding cassette domain-containing protein [Magnetospirillum sp.]